MKNDFFKIFLQKKNENDFLLNRIITNIDDSQKFVIRYRITFSLYAILYILALVDHLNLEIFNKYLIISEKRPFFNLNSIESLIVAFAPIFFSILLYLFFLAKFRRSLLYSVLNSFIESDLFLFHILTPFSSGSTRGFYRRVYNEINYHNLNKNSEIFFYYLILFLSIIFSFINPNFLILQIIITIITFIVIIINYRDFKRYLSFIDKLKKEI